MGSSAPHHGAQRYSTVPTIHCTQACYLHQLHEHVFLQGGSSAPAYCFRFNLPKAGKLRTSYKSTKEKQLSSKWDAVYMARLRSGHHWDLRTYMHRVTVNLSAATVEPTCPRCREEEEDTPHLFRCPGTIALRQEIFGTVDVPLSALTDQPMQALTLARRSLRGAGKRKDAPSNLPASH